MNAKIIRQVLENEVSGVAPSPDLWEQIRTAISTVPGRDRPLLTLVGGKPQTVTPCPIGSHPRVLH